MSPFGSGDTRQTSFAAVDVLPELPDDIEIVIKDGDLEWQHFSTGGPGGQHQNKTQSGCRLIHKPTNVRAESRTERSQHKNDANAMALLKAKLYKVEEEKRRAEYERHYDAKGEVAWGYQIRNYVLQPYTLSKDLRTDTETSQVHQVLDGDLDQFIEAFLRYKAKKKAK
jgi:peptide chain release factor 2